MAAQKKPEPAKKKSPGFAAMLLDSAGWVVREAALPVPDSLVGKKKKAKGGKKK